MTELHSADFSDPAILLFGHVDDAMYNKFRTQLKDAPREGLVVVELSTRGGDPEVARMMGEDIRFHSDLDASRRFVFLGKAAIYSAGTTFMSFFKKENRYLTPGTRLMIHERQFDKDVKLAGPLTSCAAVVRAKLHEIEASIAIQNEGFAYLIKGSNVTIEEVLKRAPDNWYIEAEEAVSLGLIQAVV
jgi:ATP-dependent protease ClpP protease subunit